MKSRPKMPSPTALMLTMSKVAQVRAMLGEARDAESIMATIESETDAVEKLDLVVEVLLADKALSDQAYARGKRLKERAEFARIVAMQIMEQFGTSRIERAEYTASIGSGVPSVHITDENLIPRRLMTPDKDAIRSAIAKGEDVPGATIGNVQPRLTIRTT